MAALWDLQCQAVVALMSTCANSEWGFRVYMSLPCQCHFVYRFNCIPIPHSLVHGSLSGTRPSTELGLICSLSNMTICHARWDVDFHYSQQGAKSGTYARFGAFCADVAHFDAAYFRLPASEAVALDPHTRMLLELSQVRILEFFTRLLPFFVDLQMRRRGSSEVFCSLKNTCTLQKFVLRPGT